MAYFVWKSVGISHTIPDFKTVLEKGTNGIIEEINLRQTEKGLTKDQTTTLESMKLTLDGVTVYAKNLSEEARRQAQNETSPHRIEELMRLSDICAKVPMKPAETLDEAVNALRII